MRTPLKRFGQVEELVGRVHLPRLRRGELRQRPGDRGGRRLPGERREPVGGRSGQATRPDHARPQPAPAGPVGNYRWVVCALLFFATTVNYIDRQILALIKEILDEELGWTNETVRLGQRRVPGRLRRRPAGLRLVRRPLRHQDRLRGLDRRCGASPRWATRWSGSVNGFFAARVALGVSEGGNFPSAIKAVALWFPKRERAFATAIFNAGTNVGAIIAPAMIPAIALTFGWRWAFILAGIAGFLWLFFWFPIYDVPEKLQEARPGRSSSSSTATRTRAAAAARPWASLRALQLPQTWSFIIAKFLTDPVWWFFLIWLPDYFKTTRGLDIKHSWVHLVTIYAIVTVLSIVGGWVTGYLTKRGWTRDARAQDRHVPLRAVRPADPRRDEGRRLAGGAADRPRRRRAPGLVGEPVHDGVRHVPEEGRGHGHRPRRHGGLGRRLPLPDPHRAGCSTTSRPRATSPRATRSCSRICAFAYLVSFAIHHLLAPEVRADPGREDRLSEACP